MGIIQPHESTQGDVGTDLVVVGRLERAFNGCELELFHLPGSKAHRQGCLVVELQRREQLTRGVELTEKLIDFVAEGGVSAKKNLLCQKAAVFDDPILWAYRGLAAKIMKVSIELKLLIFHVFFEETLLSLEISLIVLLKPRHL